MFMENLDIQRKFCSLPHLPTIPQAKFVVDHQIARGINFFEFMFWLAGVQTSCNWMSDPGMKGLNKYTNRTTYLMSQGKPGSTDCHVLPHIYYVAG